MYEEIDQEFLLEEIIDRLNNLIRIGQVCEVGLDGKVKVKIGEITTDWLDVLQNRAGKSIKIYSPPEPGESVLIISPMGDLEQGYVLPGLFTDAIPVPKSTSEAQKYVSNGSQLTLTLSPGKFGVLNEKGSLIASIADAFDSLKTATAGGNAITLQEPFQTALEKIKSFDSK
ncbi:MAG: phage baseplate assembly protein V [Oligoflexales bacterium]